MDETQDAFDIALARWAIRDKIPLLAICRGNQLVNVALGGTLIQDMTEEIGRDHRELVHDIELDARIAATRCRRRSSDHHLLLASPVH